MENNRVLYVTDKNGAVLTKLRERDGISSCYIDNKQNSESTLSFSMLVSSEKYQFLSNAENLIIADDKVYTMLYDGDSVNEKKDTGNKNTADISLVERQYLLGKDYVTAYNSTTTYDHIDNTMVVVLSGGAADLSVNGVVIADNPFTKGSAGYALYAILYGSGWTVGTVDVDGTFDLETSKKSILENIKSIQELWGGILIFDSLNKVVHLRSEEIYQPYHGYGIRFKFNETGLERNINKNIVTRLYVYGKDGLNISASNGGKEYLENYNYTSTPLYGLIENNDISNVGDLITYGTRELEKLAKPQITLKISLIDRSLLDNVGVSFAVSDMVDVVDKDLSDSSYRARVTEKKYNFFQPWECSTVTLGDEEEVFTAKIKYALNSADKVNNLVNLVGQVSSDNITMSGTRQTMTSYVQLTNEALEAGFKVIGVDGYERTGKTTISADGIDVYNGGVVIRDRQNDIKIYMDGSTGNIIFSGDLYGASGTFKGALEAASGTFAGALQAATGSFSGSVTAQSGYIGSWQILDGGIINVNNSLALTAEGEIVAANGNFNVDTDGKLTANGAEIVGAFSASTTNSNVEFSNDTMLIYFANKDNAGNLISCCKISPTEFYFYSYENGEINSGISYKNGELELIKPVSENGDKYTTISDVNAAIEKEITDTTGLIRLYLEGQSFITQEEADSVYTKQTNLYSGIENYIDTEAGTASIVSACSGTYLTQDDAKGFTSRVEVQNIIAQELSESGGSIKLFVEGKKYLTVDDGESLFIKQTELYSGIENYIDTEAGTASIVSACSGTYMTYTEAEGLTTRSEVQNIIAQELSEDVGSIKMFVEGKKYINKEEADSVYTKQVDLYSGVESYVNTSKGTASIVSACSGTFQTVSDMDGYAQITEVEASITQAITSYDAQILLKVQKTYQAIDDMSGYSTKEETSSSIKLALDGITLSTYSSEVGNQTTSTLKLSNGTATIGTANIIGTTATQAATIAADAIKGITLSVSSAASGNQTTSTLKLSNGTATIGTANIIGTTATQAATIAADAIKGITLSVTNGASSSTIAIKSGSTQISSEEIKFTGMVTFDSLKTQSSSTIINGGNITTGTISADRINADELCIKKITNSSKQTVIDCTSSYNLYIGGTSTNYGNVDTVHIKANQKIELTSWGSSYGMTIDTYNSAIYSKGKSSLGNISYPWNNTYINDINFCYGTSIIVKGYGSYSNYTLAPSSSGGASLGTSSYRWNGYFYNFDIGGGSINIGNSSAKLGFFGKSPITKQRLSNTDTVNTLIKALKNYGLFS